MKYFSQFSIVFLLVFANINQVIRTTEISSHTFVVGVLRDGKYDGGVESLRTFMNSKLDDYLNIKRLVFSELSMNRKGGVKEHINYFKSQNTSIILDLQRNNDKAGILADYSKVPIISVSPQSMPRSPYVIALYPDITIINDAIVEYLLRYKIEDVILLFDQRRSRQAMNLHTKCQRNYIRVEMMPELIMDDMELLKEVIRMAWTTQIKTVLLLCDTGDIKTVVKATLQTRLYDKDREDWKWITSDMDFLTPDYKPLEGFSGFILPEPREEAKSLIDFDRNNLLKHGFKKPVYSNIFYASVLDALQLINQIALRLKSTRKNKIIGDLILETLPQIYLSPCTSDKGKNCSLTGKIEFDENGLRKIDDLDFVVINDTKLSKKGKWNSEPENSRFPKANTVRWVGDVVENYICYEDRDNEPMKKSKKNFTIMVKKSDKPFAYKSKSSPDGFEGFTIDIVRELAKRMHFDYNFVVVKHGGSGKKQENGEWDGFVGALYKKKVDMATGSFTINAEREKEIDFSKPFMDFRMALILRVPEEEKNLFNFHKPFSAQIWFMVVLTVFVMTFILYCVDYFSPLGYRKTAEDTGEGEEFNLMNSLWFATASMLQQGGDNTPKAPSGRILATAFWFFILIIISTYTANLAAFFTNKKIESKIKSLEDLVSSKMEYGVLDGGQLHNFLKNSNAVIHRKMFSHIDEKQTAVRSSREGVNKSRQGGYAYLTETPILEYYSKRKPCNTILVKNLLEVKSYGFGLPKNSENTNALSVEILKLREEGFIERRRKFWWEDKSECSPREPASATVTLGLHSLGGVFIVMIGGSVISFVLLAIEIKFKWIIDLIMSAQENHAAASSSDEQLSEAAVMRVEISQGERTLNPINRVEQPRRRWFNPLGLSSR